MNGAREGLTLGEDCETILEIGNVVLAGNVAGLMDGEVLEWFCGIGRVDLVGSG